MSKHTAPEPVRELYRSLRTVIDPELGENIVDLGLIYEVAVHNGLARIVMTTTTPGCPAASVLKDAVRLLAATVPGIVKVDVRLTYEPPWRPEMINDMAKRRLSIA